MSDSEHGADTPPTDIGELRDEIERTREELVETTQALTDKLDVKRQVGSSAESAKQRLLGLVDRVRASISADPVPVIVGVATLVAVLVALSAKEVRR